MEHDTMAPSTTAALEQARENNGVRLIAAQADLASRDVVLQRIEAALAERCTGDLAADVQQLIEELADALCTCCNWNGLGGKHDPGCVYGSTLMRAERAERERDEARAQLGDHRASIGAHKLRVATDERDFALDALDTTRGERDEARAALAAETARADSIGRMLEQTRLDRAAVDGVCERIERAVGVGGTGDLAADVESTIRAADTMAERLLAETARADANAGERRRRIDAERERDEMQAAAWVETQAALDQGAAHLDALRDLREGLSRNGGDWTGVVCRADAYLASLAPAAPPVAAPVERFAVGQRVRVTARGTLRGEDGAVAAVDGSLVGVRLDRVAERVLSFHDNEIEPVTP
jgi:hypothetical protein